MLYRIGFFFLFCVSLFGTEHVYLKTPNISQQEFIGTNVGIRPFRKTGVRLEHEYIQDKLIVHNYGYGGSGLTLSFGGAERVLQILKGQKIASKSVAVLGAGVIGLTTAYELLERGYEVHIYSDGWNPNLTSNVAAGIWTPLSFPSDIPEEKKNLHQRMLEISEKRFLKSTTASPEFAGVKIMRYYRLMADAQEPVNISKTSEKVIVHLDNGLVKNGYRTYRLGIDGKLFMEDLFAKVKIKGAALHLRHFESIEDLLQLEEPIIINCMSIGARHIFGDDEFIPVRGQLVYYKLENGFDYVLSHDLPSSDYFVVMYPWSDRLILGGVYEIGEETPINTPDVINNIIQNAEKCLSGEL